MFLESEPHVFDFLDQGVLGGDVKTDKLKVELRVYMTNHIVGWWVKEVYGAR